jgi:hypothetical protein
MTQKPVPLVPSDCDLTDFNYMPLDVRRLRDSDLASLESPEACWAAVLLWCASWHQVPAASLPDDDRVLSQLAGFGRVVKEWQRIREGSLRGWVKCNDGRLYHPVVAEKALEAWQSKIKHAYGKFSDRIRKENKLRAEKGLSPIHVPTLEEWNSSGRTPEIPPAPAGIPPEKNNFPPESISVSAGKEDSSAGIPPENSLKGEGEGEGEVNLNSKPPLASAVSPPIATEARAENPPDGDVPTPAGQVALACRGLGYGDASSSDFKLKALIKAGLEPDEIIAVATEAKGKGKGFRWVLATAENRRRDASNVQPLPAKPSNGNPSAPAKPVRVVGEFRRNPTWKNWEEWDGPDGQVLVDRFAPAPDAKEAQA